MITNPVPVLLNLIIVTFFSFHTYSQPQIGNDLKVSPCIENPTLYEDLLIPTKSDTIEYQKIYHRYSKFCSPNFFYDDIAIARGLIDTFLMSDKHLDSFKNINEDFKRHFIFSPLIAEGEVIKIFYEDTQTPNDYMYNTYILIRLKNIIKSKYNVKKDDYVIAKTNLYGIFRDKEGLGVIKGSEIEQYIVGKSYLFAFNKYNYMYHYYMLSNKYRDKYCPYSFCLDITDHNISEAYDKKAFDINTLKLFLNIK